MKTKVIGIRALALPLVPILAACGTAATTQQRQPTPTPMPPAPALERPTYIVQRGTVERPLNAEFPRELDRFLTGPSSVLYSRFARLSAGSTDAPLARLRSCESGYPTENGDLHSPSVAARVAAQSMSHEDEID